MIYRIMNDEILRAAQVVEEADTIFISAGAGMGVDSGLPDFRGNTGFWEAYPCLEEEGLSFQDLANPAWFHDDPRRAWGFYGHRLNLYQKTAPHQGFEILQSWCNGKTGDPFVFTSNVDGHFQKSGFHHNSIYECHGSINHLQCAGGCTAAIWPAEGISISVQEDRLVAEGDLPTCPYCSGVARPNILMFGDAEWLSNRSALQHEKFKAWQLQHGNKKIVTIELGAGKAIPTARYASESMPGELVRINPRDSDGCNGVISIPLGAIEALRAIDSVLNNDEGT